MRTEYPDNKWKLLIKKLAYPYENFNKLDDFQNPDENLKKEDFFRKLENDCPSDEEIESTKEIIKLFNIKSAEELTKLFLKSDVLLPAYVFQKFIKVSINELGINTLFCVNLPGYTWQCGLYYTGLILQTLQDKDMILLLENIILGGISSVVGDKYVK